MDLAAGTQVILQNVVSRPELNGRRGTVLGPAKQQEGRYKVQVEGEEKKMALKPDNLRLAEEEAADEESTAPEIVAVKASGSEQRVAVVLQRQGSKAQVEFDDSATKWVESARLTPLEPADDNLVPTEFLYCRVRARDPRSSKPKAFREASVDDIRVDPAGRPRLLVSFDDEEDAPRWLLLDDLRAENSAAAAPAAAPPTTPTPVAKAATTPKPKGTAAGKKAVAAAAAAASADAGGDGGGGKKKEKKEKEKRAPTSYMLYAESERAATREAHPDAPFGEIQQKLGAAWRALGDEQRAEWTARAAEGKAALEAQKEREQAEAAKAGASQSQGVGGGGGGAGGGSGSGGGGGSKAAAPAAAAGKKTKAADAAVAETAPGEKRRRKQPMAAAEGGGEGGGGGDSGGAAAKRNRSEDEAGGGGGGGGAAAKRHARAKSTLNASASDAWEAALDALQPQEDDEDGLGAEGAEGGGGGGAAAGGASSAAPPAQPARDPRMQGFRIGGMRETEEERGEWCGPWSTATQLIERREQARLEREAAAAETGGSAAPLVKWVPKRGDGMVGDGGSSGGGGGTRREREGGTAEVPSLQSMTVAFLVRHIDAVASFGVLPPSAMHAIAAALCARRKMSPEVLPLFTAEEMGTSELLLPVCDQLGEEDMVAALERLAASNPLQLSVVHLGFCGHGFTTKAAALLHPCANLHTLRLTGCYRLSTSALVQLAEARGVTLRVLQLSGNSQLKEEAIEAVGTHCGDHLEVLQLEDCAQLPAEAVAPLGRLRKLHTLSLSGLCLLDDAAVAAAVAGSAASLESVELRGCSLLTDAAALGVARSCVKLRELNLSGCELVTDEAIVELARSTYGLHALHLKRCVQLSDAAVQAVAEGGRGTLRTLSLNNVPALSDLSLQALASSCATSLEEIDISWCRGVTDDGVGLLADSCPHLRSLTLWGCSQLTQRFFSRHSNAELRIVGRGPTQ